jgi:ribosomal-protein-alanine N-acetyltransferase
LKLRIQDMNERFASEILNWKYEKPYDFYNNAYTEERLKELLDGSYYALVSMDDELFGCFCTGKYAQVPAGHQIGAYNELLIDMGLGMNPLYVGQGMGTEFCSFILQVIEEKFKDTPIRLTVATFNGRAVRLYEKLGFVKEVEFRTKSAEFMTMVRNVKRTDGYANRAEYVGLNR